MIRKTRDAKCYNMEIRLLPAIILLLITTPVLAQKKSNTPPSSSQTDEGLKFTALVELKATPVKNQAATGTCWSFATTSFIESELLRMGKGEYDLSEMFIIRQNYIDKLKDNYLKQGKGNLDEGGLSHDWMRVFNEFGIVPDEVYRGLNYGSPTHNHGELNSFIKAVATVPLERRQESVQYFQIVDAILDTYLGKVPETFTYKDVIYTPKSFAQSLGINPADYVEITSFTQFPFYTRGILEIPDNWTMDGFYNVPLDELIGIIDYSLNNGYTVAWDGDVSESGFTHSKGIATFPETNVTQEMRQTGYENFTTTDDHLMHLTGITKDQNGVKYYITKNSWGTERNSTGGYLNMSEDYARAKTLFVMVNRNAVPQAIRTKLGL
jgi:aminopeptidase C